MEDPAPSFAAFIVHAWSGAGRVFFAGRMQDGRSFAAAVEPPPQGLLVRELDARVAEKTLSPLEHSVTASALVSFEDGLPLSWINFSRRTAHSHRFTVETAARLREAGIPNSGPPGKDAERWLLDHEIWGSIRLSGDSRPGKRCDIVFPSAELSPDDEAPPIALKVASFDLETDEHTRAIRAAAFELRSFYPADAARRGDTGVAEAKFGSEALYRMHLCAPEESGIAWRQRAQGFGLKELVIHDDEASLLDSFFDELRRADPDIIVGWNVLDFDFPRLAERCAALGLTFDLSRSVEPSRWLPGEGRRSAAVIVPGRQVIDALRAVRAGPDRYEDYTLETVANRVLGIGKLVSASGEEKLQELDRLYREDPLLFAKYCWKDASLVLDILAKTGLFSLTFERARLTGVSLDKAWASVASFERAYGRELRRRNIAEPFPSPPRPVSGAAGGTVLTPEVGLFQNVAVFDFRSLYPTLIRTFNVDPLAMARAKAANAIIAPNGARFSKEKGILPDLIANYFEARRQSLARGDETAAYVFKILMNSFYGVLGTPTCRYARTELAGAITSFARKWLHFSRDHFIARGYRVLYGDTDSVFVATGFDDSLPHDELVARCQALAVELNDAIRVAVRREFDLESFMEMRFEKAYRRFLIPSLRMDGSSPVDPRGRAKGYAGLLCHPLCLPEKSLEVKGMEAVRRDTTPFARRVQLELLSLVFADAEEGRARAYLESTCRDLSKGRFDGELVYRRRLVRPPNAYRSSIPPHVKVARALGWTDGRGTVEYVWTSSGAEPLSAQESPLDRDHYLLTQVLPFAESLFVAAGWDAATLRSSLLGARDGQGEFSF